MELIKKRSYFSGSLSKLSSLDISEPEWRDYFPSYLRESFSFTCGSFKFMWIQLIQLVLKFSVNIILRPRKGPVEELEIDEVEKVYDREAAKYDAKHHLTTRGMDTTWRRLAGWFVVNFGRKNGGRVSVLDICTGTGLTVCEMATLLAEWKIQGSISGLDYNAKMLEVAKAKNIYAKGVKIDFVRGDAMNLAFNVNHCVKGMSSFSQGSIDVVTQMFGIGGIFDPLKVFDGILQVLKPGGQYFLIDMHQPIFNQPGEWPLLLKWLRFPVFEAVTYNQTTLPLVLNRLWGWRDTTMDFYLLPLTVYKDEDGKKWGFEVVSFEVESQRWWLSLPIMPVAKIIVEKIMISDAEYEKRHAIISSLKNT